MEKLFRLEFNEKQQQFHHHYPHQTHVKENYQGWKTITENCSYDEWNIFEAYLSRNVPHHRKMAKKERYSIEYVLKSFSELQSFYSNLLKYKMSICKLQDKKTIRKIKLLF